MENAKKKITLQEYLNTSFLTEKEKFILNQTLNGESEKTLEEWEKIKNIKLT